MLNSLLNAVAVDSLILDIFIILGVVVAASLVVYFLWEAVNSLANKKGEPAKDKINFDEKPVKENQNVAVLDYSLDKQEETVQDATPVETVEETLIDQDAMVDVDEDKAAAEQAEVDAKAAEEERANAERRAYLEARRQELIRRMQEEMDEDEDETNDETEGTTEENAETVEESVEEPAEETVQQPEVEAEAETVEEVAAEEKPVDTLAAEREALAAEKAKYEAMVKELEDAKAALAQQKVETVTETVVIPTNGVLSLDELKAKLAEAEERFKETDKQFRQCKKEYSPLARVWNTHERDEKKLRRKEALVAKQKVILYGVNNYADIDSEKAKKLEEDLDLLDGLKLSVQHCEEVMKKNAERYPLLESMYNVLKERNDELKADIEYYKAEIAKLEEESQTEQE